jgi:hypothetical protein
MSFSHPEKNDEEPEYAGIANRLKKSCPWLYDRDGNFKSFYPTGTSNSPSYVQESEPKESKSQTFRGWVESISGPVVKF